MPSPYGDEKYDPDSQPSSGWHAVAWIVAGIATVAVASQSMDTALLVVIPPILLFLANRKLSGALLAGGWVVIAPHTIQSPEIVLPEALMPEPIQAPSISAAPAPPPRSLEDHEIALPYEGSGRKLSVPVAFNGGSDTIETFMQLDTGATYTTLPMSVLRDLDMEIPDDAPTLKLHTANGIRTARLVLIDEVWLGDQKIEAVGVTVCEDCANRDTAGLLGLNVLDGFNTTIDADAREVIFTRRSFYDRVVDVRPWVDLDAEFRRRGRQIDAKVFVMNDSWRTVRTAEVWVRCGEDEWTVSVGPIAPHAQESDTIRVEPDECDSFRYGLRSADW